MTAALVVIGLMVAGLVLVAIEILAIPGFGVFGVLGALAAVGASYIAVTELPPTFAGVTIFIGVAATVATFWLFPRTRAAKALILETQTLGGAADPSLKDLLGLEGKTLTPLRPSGTAKIAEKPVDVVSDGQYVETGETIRVILVEGSRVVVEPVA